jgi:hypothetical protein
MIDCYTKIPMILFKDETDITPRWDKCIRVDECNHVKDLHLYLLHGGYTRVFSIEVGIQYIEHYFLNDIDKIIVNKSNYKLIDFTWLNPSKPWQEVEVIKKDFWEQHQRILDEASKLISYMKETYRILHEFESKFNTIRVVYFLELEEWKVLDLKIWTYRDYTFEGNWFIQRKLFTNNNNGKFIFQ